MKATTVFCLLFPGSLVDDEKSREATGLASFSKVEDGWKCKICGRVSKEKCNASTHYVDMHLEADYVFQCPQCPSKLGSRNSLRNHLKAKHNTVMSRIDLNPYMRLKSGTLPYV